MEIQARKRVIVTFIISTPLLTKVGGRFVEKIVINIRKGHSLSVPNITSLLFTKPSPHYTEPWKSNARQSLSKFLTIWGLVFYGLLAFTSYSVGMPLKDSV